VVLSDHGQSVGATFRQRYGLTLGELIHQLLRGEQSVHQASGSGEGWGHLNAVLTEMVKREGVVGEGSQRLLAQRESDGYVSFGPDREHRERVADEHTDVVVCASGNLALVYFADHPGRLSLEYLVADFPGLIEGLAGHPGIGFLLVHSEARGPVVLGADGYRRLDDDSVEGTDPLAAYSPQTAHFLRRLTTYGNVGDIVVNSLLEPATGEVAAFEELIGCHGGAGGWQTQPFICFPNHWTAEDPSLLGAESVHGFLSAHLTGSLDGARKPLAETH
jgi:hypothetical protein